MSCLLLTEKLKELAKNFPDETVESVKNLVSLYQEKKNAPVDDVGYPTVEQLKEFIKEIRGNKNPREEAFQRAIAALSVDGITLDNSLIEQFLKNSSENNPTSQIFKQLITILRNNNIPINIVIDKSLKHIAARRRDGFKTATVRFNPILLTEYLNENSSDSAKDRVLHIVTHELVHAVTAEILTPNSKIIASGSLTKAQIEFIDQVNQLYKECRKALKGTEWYGLTNVNEFIAEALTNRNFQEVLKDIKVEEKSAFKKFINLLTKIFNKIFKSSGTRINNTALEEVLNISQEYFKYANRGLNSISNETKAFLEKNGVEDIEQYIKDQKEMEAIKQKAIADGTFMKAPNGKPTNLTERQWLQVRTTNFKNWFGDWENDPANASKVVDENGEPLVVYHGGATDIHVFHPGTKEENTTGYGTYKDHRTGEEILVDSAKTMFFSSNPFVGTSYATMHGILYFQKMERQIEDILFNSTKENGIHFTKEQFENGIEDLYKFLTNAAEINPRFQALKDYIQKLKKEGKQVTKENEREEILKMLRELRSKIQDFTSKYLMNSSEWENVYSRAKEVIDTYNNPDGIERLLRGEIPETIQREWDLYEKIQSQREKEGLTKIGNYDELHLTLGKGRYYLIYDGKELSIWNPEHTDPKVTDMTREELSKFLSEAKQANQIGIEELKNDTAYQTVKGKAQEYAVYLNIRKPLVHDYEGTHQGQGYKQSKKYSFGYVAARQVKKAIEEGNDGVVYKNLYDPYLADNYGVFNPNQIKSATANNGDFSLTNNDIDAFAWNEVQSARNNIKGENISSRGSEFAKKLTNPGNNLEIEYEGRKFRNAEHAYQTWKSGTFDEVAYNDTSFKPRGSKPANRELNYDIMVKILSAKFRQHPELIQGINERGGLKYLEACTHNVTGDKFWESNGENKFISALIEAYLYVNGNENFQPDVESEDKTAKFGVIIDPNLKSNYQEWQRQNPNGIVAYRLGHPYNTAAEAEAGRIGNPFSEQSQERETVVQFYEWLMTGNNRGNPKATEEYRQAILDKILNTPEGSPILYYKELGRASHATVIGYLVNHKDAVRQAKTNNNNEHMTNQKPFTTVKEVRETFDGYFEGGGADINDDFPNATIEDINKYLRYKYRQESLSDEEVIALGNRMLGINPQAESQAQTQSQKTETPKKDYGNPDESYNVPKPTSLQTQAKVDLLWDPQVRRDRVRLLATMFSNEVTRMMKEEEEALRQLLEKATDEKEIADLADQLDNLDRFTFIQKKGPRNIFLSIYDWFKSYVDMTEDNKVEFELRRINSKKRYAKLSDATKLKKAKEMAEHRDIEFRKLVDNQDAFFALCEETSSALLVAEGLKIDPVYNNASKEINDMEDDPEGNNSLEGDPEEGESITPYKDGWMTSFRQVSAYSSLSQAVRAALRQMPKVGYDGEIERDDIDNPRYFDAEYVHAVFMEKLRFMINSDDMLPLLKKLAKQKRWVKKIIKMLENDETFFSQFYQDMRKDFTNFWVQKKVQKKDGSYVIQTVQVNKPEGIYFLLDAWRDNFESGTILNANSVYGSDGRIIQSNVEKGYKITEELAQLFRNKTIQEEVAMLDDSKVFNKIKKLLNMMGIDVADELLKLAMSEIPVADSGVIITAPFDILLNQVTTFYSEMNKREYIVALDKNERLDLINYWSNVYSTIARVIADVTEDAIESSSREGDKTYYAHANPNYLGKLIKNLKNVAQNKKRFEEFIQHDFKDYEWFFKDGKMRCAWLAELAEDPQARDILDHKVVLNQDKVDYSDWDSLDYTLALLGEYWSDPHGRTAWYYVPILSDSPSAEFIKYKRITGENYKSKILDKLVDVVCQEYDRIMLVRERDIAYQNGSTNVEPIANYDISRDKEGNIKSLGGAEFKFFPALNNHKYSDGRTFLEKLEDMQANSTGAEIKAFIKEALDEIMDTDFEAAYRHWDEIGLFEETENGKAKYLPWDGRSVDYKNTLQALTRAKKALGSEWHESYEALMQDLLNNRPTNTRDANIILENIKVAAQLKYSMGEVSDVDMNWIDRYCDLGESNKEALREYFYNSVLATSQIIELTTTDLAYYKNLEDFSKRYKEVHAPSLRLNTKATFHGERVGREWERTIYIKDEEIVSEVLPEMVEVVTEKHKLGEIADYDAAYMLAGYGYSNHTVTDKNGKKTKYCKMGKVMVKTSKVNVADAQAYRSLSSYKAILTMAGQWTDEQEQAYNNIKQGNWNMKDFSIIWQTKKPYLYTQINNDSGIAGHTGIKTPVQHKNSEFLLMAMHELVASAMKKSAKLKAINKFMEDHQIDVVQFESTTKVGKQGVIDLSDVNTEEDVTRRLEEATGIGVGNENPNVVHKVPYEDYGFQTATPEHLIDAIQLVGTQIRKLISADIADDTVIEIVVSEANGKKVTKKMTKKEWLDLYNAVITENIIEKFQEIDSIFSDPKEVERIVLQEIRNSDRYGIELERACTLDENGHFNIPLFDPVQSMRVQQLLNSIIKSRVTKQQIKGGALIQATAYGLTDDLHIVFEGEGANKRIKYIECYMPAYSKEFFEGLMQEGTHELDISKLPEDLRRAVGYRVPTENKYSMVPLRIKGFLPQQNGSAIMLPAEITKIAGSDFDVDKLYIMLPEFNVQRYDMKRARFDYAKQDAIFREVMSKFTHSSTAQDILASNEALESDTKAFREWFNEHKEEYRLAKPKYHKVKYDFTKSPQHNSRRARNNLFIDMIYGVLTNSKTTTQLLKPGNFDPQKRVARIIAILESTSKKDLEKILTDKGIDLTQTYERFGKTYKKPAIAHLFDLDLDTLEELAEETKPMLNPLSPVTQVNLHQRNMTGAHLIGIYANHNVSHALMQLTNLALNDATGVFKLNGKILKSLHGIKNADNEIITETVAGFLAASVDNAKDPVLAWLNQNLFTADASMLLARLGHNPLEIGLLMMQPVVKEMTDTYFKQRKSGKTKDTIVDEVIEKYRTLAKYPQDFKYENIDPKIMFSIEGLAENILTAKDTDNNADYYRKQFMVALLMKRIMNSAEALSKVVAATRADTTNGAAGPSIADTEIKIDKVNDLYKSLANPNFQLCYAGVIQMDLLEKKDCKNEDGSINYDALRKELLQSPLPYVQAFYTLGLEGSAKMLSNYFPQFSRPFRDVVETLRLCTKSERLNVKTRNSIYNDLFAYILTKTSFFGNEVIGEGENKKTVTMEKKRNDFINNFAAAFDEILKNNPDIGNLQFIRRLKTKRADDKNPARTIVFKNVGSLTSTLRERFMQEWASMLYSNNPESVKLAMNLFRYCFYRNGLSFGPSTFAHLAPTIIRKVVPDYVETLESLLTSEDDYRQFIHQYLMNHLDNRKFVPEVPDINGVEWTDADGKPVEQVVINLQGGHPSRESKTIVRRTESIEGVKMYDYFWYIAKKINGKYEYYRIGRDFENKKDVDYNVETAFATYYRVEPLGFKNSFIEYEYGKNADEINSVINRNAAAENPYSTPGAGFDSGNNNSDINSDYVMETIVNDNMNDVVGDVFKQIYGEELSPDDPKYGMEPLAIFRFTKRETEEAKQSFKDAEDNPLC